ncbi:SRPBCC family protein [Ekhidna sp.]|uniref:SRPBCC family protein n=1 Tax=Ekhidna sp. TaxID=2608089 RepID=UPI003BAB9D0C
MKFSGSIDINQSQEKVADFFADPAYLKEYQEGFEKKELLEGEAGKEGAVSKMYYKNGNHEMVLTETITKNDLPHSFEAFYHHKHMDNTMKCTFTKLRDGQTRYATEVVYTRIDWVMPRLISILFPGMYKKPARRWMENFKSFVEKQ